MRGACAAAILLTLVALSIAVPQAIFPSAGSSGAGIPR